jgi:septal ring factor EnvC (AmiA/AmiB activator)
MTDRVYEEVMAMSEDELRAEFAKEGKTLEQVADEMQAVFERAKTEAQMRKAIQAWLKCPAERRPSPYALGQAIASIAAAHRF